MFFKSTYNELIKIIAKPRSYLGLAAITLIVGLILLAMKLDGGMYISLLTSPFEESLTFEGNLLNGNLVGFIILQMLIIHVPLLIAFVTGDLVSGEAAMGTIRMLLTKPVSRTKILLSKYLAGCIYTFFVLVWLAFMAIIMGKWLFGIGDLMVLKSDGLVVLQQEDVAWRFFFGFAIAFLSMVMIATLSLTFSCFSENSIGPIVSTMGIIILFTIIGTIEVPLFDTIRPYLFTTHMAAWRFMFDKPLLLNELWFSLTVLLAHIFVLLGIALYKFQRKDILS